MEAISALADFLGAPDGAMAAIKSARGTRNRGHWLNINRSWALNCMAAARDGEAGQLVTVDAALAASLKHEPLLPNAPRDHRWVLHDGPRSRAGVVPGSRVLADDPAAAAAASLPDFVLEALRSEAGHLALAGGAALAAVTAPELQTASPADFDLFVYGFTGDADTVSASADALVRRVASIVDDSDDRDVHNPIVSRSAVTLLVSTEEGEPVLQIILRVAKSPADILGGFDLSPAKVCVLYERPDAEELTVLAAPDWPLAMRHGAYALDGRAWSRATALRVFKYAAKGFDALVPALTDRRRLRYQLTAHEMWWGGPEKLQHLDGFELLYALEQSITQAIKREMRGKYNWRMRCRVTKRTSTRITPEDVEKVARKLQLEQRTDYASALKTMRSLVYVLEYAVRSVLHKLGAIPLPDALQAPLGWRQPWSRAQFHPVVADLADALSLMDTPVN